MDEFTTIEIKRFNDAARKVLKTDPGKLKEFTCPLCSGLVMGVLTGDRLNAQCCDCRITIREQATFYETNYVTE